MVLGKEHLTKLYDKPKSYNDQRVYFHNVLSQFLKIYFEKLVSMYNTEKTSYWENRVLKYVSPRQTNRNSICIGELWKIQTNDLLNIIINNWKTEERSILHICYPEYYYAEKENKDTWKAIEAQTFNKDFKNALYNCSSARVDWAHNANQEFYVLYVFSKIRDICKILPIEEDETLCSDVQRLLMLLKQIEESVDCTATAPEWNINDIMSRPGQNHVQICYFREDIGCSLNDKKVVQLSNSGTNYDVGTPVKDVETKHLKDDKCAESQENTVSEKAETLFNLSKDYENGENNVEIDRRRALLNLYMAAELGSTKAQCTLSYWYYTGKNVNKNDELAFHWAMIAAECGDYLAQNYVGIYYSKGSGVEKDETTAREWFIASAMQGYVSAQFNLALDYNNGHGGVKNLQKAVEWYTKAANQGHAGAQCNLGVCYELGDGVEENLKEAIKYYEKAAENGHVRCCSKLGHMYEHGCDALEKNLQKAVEYYTKAVENGYVDAWDDVGRCYERGDDSLEKNLQKAVEYYTKAAENGYVEAWNNLGRCYEQSGNGLEKNLQKAVEYYTKAAENGYVKAWDDVGRCYERGDDSLEKNLQKAVECYTKTEDRDSWYNVARCYEQGGYGLEKNLQKAVEYYTKAAEKLHAEAQLWLAHYYESSGADLYEVMKQYKEAASLRHTLLSEWPMWVFYDYGDGESKNSQEAFEWYKKEAEQGQVKAMFNMGVYYERGHVVDKNLKEAVEWYKRAAEQGQVDAMYNLGVCYELGGYGIEKNLKEAMKWYKTAAEHGYVDAMFNLGVCCEQGGEGVEKNLKEAMEWYKKAAETEN